MNSKQIAAIIILSACAASALAKQDKLSLDNQAQTLLNQHVGKYHKLEYFSGATLAINIPKQPIHNYYAGNISHEPDSKPITADTLFQIGSITKSFTAAVMLQFEKEKKLSLDDTLGQWQPVYKKWSGIKLDTLLNMTSGLPNYSDTPLWNATEFKLPTRAWSNVELIDFVYPNDNFMPPLRPGYFYTNTGYILSAMIVNKITDMPFKEALKSRIFKAANLTNTYYPLPEMSVAVSTRMAHGYNYNQYDNPALVGKDVSDVNLTWAAAAGGIVSNAEDITKWIRALFIDDAILDKDQKKKLTSLISIASGKPVKTTTANDPRAFGLGVIQAYNPDKSIGKFWFYEGETLGFRALYMYTPCNGVVISSIFNSATNSENDHASNLMTSAYKLVLKEHPALRC